MKDAQYVVSVDIGTTETKSVLVSTSGLIDSYKYDNKIDFPQQGYAEQDPTMLENSIVTSIKKLIEKQQHAIEQIKGLVFTSQMQGILPVDSSGTCITKLITWMDTRAADLTKEKFGKGFPKISGYPLKYIVKFLSITGGAPGYDGKNTLSKSLWIKQYMPEIYEGTYKFMDTKDYAVFLATSELVTSIDMAYVSWLMDTRKGKMNWSPELCKMLGLDISKYLEIKPSTAIIGKVTERFSNQTGLPKELPVINGSGDLLTSAIGSGAIQKGQLHANIGTAGWVGGHYPEKKRDIPHYTGSIAAGMPEQYLILSKQETLGGALEWMKTILFNEDLKSTGFSSNAFKKMDSIVEKAPAGSNNLIFTPWLMGERSPINDAHLRGQLFNISLNNSLGDIIRSIFEGVAYNLKWGIEVVQNLTKIRNTEIRVIGGATKSDIWCQILADVWNMKVIRMKNPQFASAIGSACIGMVGLGIFDSFDKINQLVVIDREFKPNSEHRNIYNKLYSQYKILYKNNKKTFEQINSL